MAGYRTLAAKGEAELVIQRSRFIGRGFPVESEAAALAILADIRKAHWDASHNCFAYRIGPDGRRPPLWGRGGARGYGREARLGCAQTPGRAAR